MSILLSESIVERTLKLLSDISFSNKKVQSFKDRYPLSDGHTYTRNYLYKFLKEEVKKYIKEKGFNKRFIALLQDSFLIEMVTLNLEETLKNTTIKSLYLTGTKDKIINHKEEITTVESFQNPNIEIKVFEGLNHYLTDRNGIVGSSLYQMDKEALNTIINWLNK